MIIVKPRPGRGIPDFTRIKLGLSQQQLADNLGVSRSVIAMVETGKRKWPSGATALLAELSGKLDNLPSGSPIGVKRGRKPAGFTPGSLPTEIVTKFGRAYKTLEKLPAFKRRMHGKVGPSAFEEHHRYTVKSLKGKMQCEEAVKQLEHIKRNAEWHLELLWFKRNTAVLNYARFFAKMKGHEAALAGGKEMIDVFKDEPAGKELKILNTYNDLQFSLMKQKMKKYDHLSMLDIELQIGMVERGIELAERYSLELAN